MKNLLEKAFNRASHLPQRQRTMFARFILAELDAQQWENQIEEDCKKGRLNSLAEQALRDYSAGKCTRL
jgi:hypothetical protein